MSDTTQELEQQKPIEKKREPYIDNERFHFILSEAIPYFKEHNNWGKHGNEIGKIILDMMENIRNKSNFKNYQGYYLEKMKEKALVNVFSYLHKYKLETKNPFNYFTTIIMNAYGTAIKESKKKIQEISYDSEIITEMVDFEEAVHIEDAIVSEMDKKIIRKNLISKVKDEEVVKEIERMLDEMHP